MHTPTGPRPHFPVDPGASPPRRRTSRKTAAAPAPDLAREVQVLRDAVERQERHLEQLARSMDTPARPRTAKRGTRVQRAVEAGEAPSAPPPASAESAATTRSIAPARVDPADGSATVEGAVLQIEAGAVLDAPVESASPPAVAAAPKPVAARPVGALQRWGSRIALAAVAALAGAYLGGFRPHRAPSPVHAPPVAHAPVGSPAPAATVAPAHTSEPAPEPHATAAPPAPAHAPHVPRPHALVHRVSVATSS